MNNIYARLEDIIINKFDDTTTSGIGNILRFEHQFSTLISDYLERPLHKHHRKWWNGKNVEDLYRLRIGYSVKFGHVKCHSITISHKKKRQIEQYIYADAHPLKLQFYLEGREHEGLSRSESERLSEYILFLTIV